jgi:alpha-tubulin suppressor-like RCC1 family protein
MLFDGATPPTGTFASVSVGYAHACGLKADGTVACWGKDYCGQATPPAGTFKSVSSGGCSTCGLRTDGTIACWGALSRDVPSKGVFTTVSVGHNRGDDDYLCALDTDGAIACWGSSVYHLPVSPPTGSFASVSSGAGHACGVRADGLTACWGGNSSGEASPP